MRTVARHPPFYVTSRQLLLVLALLIVDVDFLLNLENSDSCCFCETSPTLGLSPSARSQGPDPVAMRDEDDRDASIKWGRSGKHGTDRLWAGNNPRNPDLLFWEERGLGVIALQSNPGALGQMGRRGVPRTGWWRGRWSVAS